MPAVVGAATAAMVDNFDILQGNLENGGVTEESTPNCIVISSAVLVRGEALYLFNGDTRLGQAIVNNRVKTGLSLSTFLTINISAPRAAGKLCSIKAP